MNKRSKLKMSSLTSLVIACYLAYYLLLSDNALHTSISCIMQYARSLALQKHLIVLGLLPIYIASMIFGAAMIGLYLGNSVPSLLTRAAKARR